MSHATFDRALVAVLEHEGGYANHPKDPGGATNKGITIATFRKWVKRDGTVADLKKLTTEQAGKVYRGVYWNAIRGDELPAGLDYAVFDFAVNSGPTRAVRYLQGILGVKADGQIGPATLKAIKKKTAAELIQRLCDDRLAFLRRLNTWPTFGKGWSRRVGGVRNLALWFAQGA